MSTGFPSRVAHRIVRAAAWLVPASRRDEWRREWDAELQHEVRRSTRRPAPLRSAIRLLARALGAVPDAAWIRRQFTLDADAVHDIAHGVRMLSKTPAFAAMALGIFAMGIGATTAIVSVADALLLRPMPVPQPDRVMTVWQQNRVTGEERLDVSPGNALDWLARARSFQALAIVEPFTFNINFAGRDADYLTAARVSDQFFSVLGTPVLHGRTFLDGEYRRGGPRVAVLSHAVWQARYGSDPAVVGRRVRLDEGDAYTVVGVLPAGLELRLFNDRGRRPEPSIWLPKQGFEDFEPRLRGQAFWNVMGRLRPDATPRHAQAEFDAISAQLAREFPETNAPIAAQVVPLRLHLVGSLRDVLPLLFGAAGLLLVVACANVANLLLARGAARGREFAVRQALGASRLRLVRQMLVETLVLAGAGGLVGLLLARWTLDLIGTLRPGDIALLDHIPIDGRAAVIACGVTVLAAVIAGLAPSLQLSRPSAVEALRSGRSGARRGVRAPLLVVEVAAALVLAVGAGLLVRSFLLIQRVDPGFSRDDVSVVQVFASRRINTPQKRIAFFQQALDRIQALPGVVAAGGVTSMPFGEARVLIRVPLAVGGRPAASGDEALAYATAVSGNYFQAMAVPLVRGRLFTAADTASSRPVVVISRSAARQFWPDGDPIGARVQFRFTGTSYDAEVIGIVGDVRHEALDAPAAAEVFLPYAHSGFYGLTFVVRTAPGSPARLDTLKQQIWDLDPVQSIYHAAMLDRLIAKTLVGRRFTLFMLGGFALATVLLASAGVYGVMSFFTSQRTREFGVRMALGANRRDIVRLVLREGLTLAAIGILIGATAALPAVRLLQALLFGVTVTDPLTFAAAGLGLLMLAAPACYLPARRALKVDPVEALRAD